MRNPLRFRLATAVAGAALLLVAGPGLPEKEGPPTDPLPIGAEVLYDQTDDASGNGAPDQDFESAFSVASCEAADDFEVTDPGGWTILGVNTIGSNAGVPSDHVNIAFYPDDVGVPYDIPLCEYVGITSYIDDLGSMTITLPTPCKLDPGVYWMSQQVRQDFGTAGQHFFSNRVAQNKMEGVWRNPGNKFGTGCVDWTPNSECGVGGGYPDYLFQIVGLGDGGDPTPAVGPFGVLVVLAALGGASGYVLARRRSDSG